MVGELLATRLLAAEVSNLAPLRDWEPVGTRLEGLMASVGGEGMTPREVLELRSLANRWRKLPDPLQAFYTKHLDDDNARACLWLVLTACRVPGSRYGGLVRLWVDDCGTPPLFHLCPSFIPE